MGAGWIYQLIQQGRDDHDPTRGVHDDRDADEDAEETIALRPDVGSSFFAKLLRKETDHEDGGSSNCLGSKNCHAKSQTQGDPVDMNSQTDQMLI